MPKYNLIQRILKFLGLLEEKEVTKVVKSDEPEEEPEEETVEEPVEPKPKKKVEKKMTNNRERFPNIVHEPKRVYIDGYDYTVYKFSFQGLGDLYNYLKSKPEINRTVFGSELSSVENSESFAGIPYKAAVEQLVNYNDPEYKEFLTITKSTAVKNLKLGAVFQSANSVAGGIVRPQALAVGDPHIYKTTKIYKVEKSVNIYTIANYLGDTTKSQVFNKAVVLTNIIHALEQEGIKVNVNVFSASAHDDEIVEVELNIKNNGRSTNYQALYRSLCNVEFLRRIIFRIRETSDVRTDWTPGYGRTCSESMMREYYHLDEDNYYFGTPDEMGIYGNDIGEDFERTVKNLKLEKVMDVNAAKERMRKSIRG